MSAASIVRSNLSAQVEDAIRHDIVNGMLRPGQRLRAQEFTERYGVSATPAREALQRLAGQGLVTLDDRQSARVADVSVRDLEEVYWLRRLLEPIALRLSFESGGSVWRDQLITATDELRSADRAARMPARGERPSWPEAHQRFHSTLFAGAESPQLLRILTNLYHHSERYRMLARERTLSTDNRSEHEAIAENVMSGDIEAAAKALASHIDATLILLRQAAFPDGGEGVNSETAPADRSHLR